MNMNLPAPNLANDDREPLIGLAALAKMAFDGADLGPLRSRLVWLGGLGVAAVLGAAACAVVRLGFDPVPWAGGVAVVIVVLYLPRELGWTRFPLLLQGTRQVKRTIAFVDIEPNTGTQISSGLQSKYYRIGPGDTLEGIYDENAAQ